jgi:DNA-binding HxlR family transcriptional regulator
MRSYGQACGLAKALDVVGDRWTLLIVRELIIRDACRYSDLLRGLPGVATNLLAERLRDLEAEGVLTRAHAPPPVATDLYALTARGRALAPIVEALGFWGAPRLAEDLGDETFQPHWMVLPLRKLLNGGAEASVAVRADGEAIAIRSGGGRVEVSLGPAPDASTRVEGPARPVFRLLTGRIGLEAAAGLGVRVEGDRRSLAGLVPRRAQAADS